MAPDTSKQPTSPLAYLVNHIALPRKLPQSLEPDQAEVHMALLNFTRDAVIHFERILSESSETSFKMKSLLSCLSILPTTFRGLGLAAPGTGKALENLEEGGSLILFVDAQNAGVVIHRASQSAIVEIFEASAHNGAIMSAPGALQRSFPGTAVSVPWETFQAPAFLKQFVDFICDLSDNRVAEFHPVTMKAGVSCIEIRDTASPTLLVDLLNSILLSIGQPAMRAPTIKRTHDDVCWDRTLLPWRRSPLWLVLRVGLQRVLEQNNGQLRGRMLYKNLMTYLISRLAEALMASSDDYNVLDHVRAKLARRAHKLHQRQHLLPFLQPTLSATLEKFKSLLENAWNVIKSANSRTISSINVPDQNHLILRLTAIRPKLLSILKQEAGKENTKGEPHLKCPQRTKKICLPPASVLTAFKGLRGIDQFVALADFETVIALSIEEWRSRSPDPYECELLGEMFQTYLKDSENILECNPENQSIRLLTLVEIHGVLDRKVNQLMPLLGDYGCDIPPNFLKRLRLTSKEHMLRAMDCETYIRSRMRSAEGLAAPSIFSESDMTGFAVRYVDEYDEQMQTLLSNVQKDAQRKQEDKRQEWNRLTAKHEELQHIAELTAHTNRLDEKGYEVHDVRPGKCTRCNIDNQMKNLKIQPIEWPLPEDQRKAKRVIFEMICPSYFRIWREITWMLITQLGRPSIEPCTTDVFQKLRDYPGLKTFHKLQAERLTLTSSTKSFGVAHYGGSKGFPCKFEHVCLRHASQFSLYDTTTCTWVSHHESTPELLHDFKRFLVADSTYGSISHTIEDSTHVPNQIIANQTACPQTVSLFEWNSFQHLRAGARTQWLNLLLELAAPNLDFTKAATSTLVLQAATELGEPSGNDFLRQSHWIFRYSTFCQEILRLLRQRFESIRANWQETQMMRMILLLVIRMHSLRPEMTFDDEITSLVRDIRITTLEWTRKISKSAQTGSPGRDRMALSMKQLHAAFICRASYAGEISAAETADEDWSPFFESGFIVADQNEVDLEKHDVETASHLMHDWTVSYHVEERARRTILRDPHFINNAIGSVWPGSHRFQPWEAMTSPKERWMCTETIPNMGEKRMRVRVNILDGRLLIEGEKLGRLPSYYLNAPQYRELFEDQQFDVFPSPCIGMSHTATSQVHGHIIHFAWRSGQIVIRAQKDGRMRELLPRTSFVGTHTTDLPYELIWNNYHWLNITAPDQGVVHIQPTDDIWSFNEDQWKISIHSSLATRGRDHLVEPNCLLTQRVSAALASIECERHMVIFERANGDIMVTLPRFGLNFRRTECGILHCEELEGSIKVEQDAKTFYGLRNCLLLEKGDSELDELLVPHGTVEAHRHDSHVSVLIDTSELLQVPYACFRLNTLLGRLESSGEPQDTLLQAYLHALTSFILPDPLTGRNGVEESLSCLQEFSRQQHGPLDAKQHHSLAKIAALTPKREYYPSHLKVMQTVHWIANLPDLVQHEDFYTSFKEIWAKSSRMEPFFETASVEGHKLIRANVDKLHARARYRTSLYNRADARFSSITLPEDTLYHSRDLYSGNERCTRAFHVSRSLQSWDGGVPRLQALGPSLEEIGAISHFNKNYVRERVPSLLMSTLGGIWGSLLAKCRQSAKAKDQQELMFVLSTLAFAEDAKMCLIWALSGVATNASLRNIKPPQYSEYIGFQYKERPSRGYICNVLRQRDRQPYVPSSSQGELRLSKRERSRLQRERYEKHEEEFQRAAQDAADRIDSQWPCQSLTIFEDPRFDIRKTVQDLSHTWRRLYGNWKLSEFADSLQDRLSACSELLQISPPQISAPMTTLREIHAFRTAPSLDEIMRTTSISSLNFHIYDIIADMGAIIKRTTPLQKSGQAFEYRPWQAQVANLRRIAPVRSGSSKSDEFIRSQYQRDLEDSIDALERRFSRESETSLDIDSVNLEALLEARYRDQANLEKMLARIRDAMSNLDKTRWLQLGDLWPVFTTARLLTYLQNKRFQYLPPSLQHLLILVGKQITRLQWSRRLHSYHMKANVTALRAEIQNPAHSVWIPEEQPEWLLLEIEMDLLIREEQIDIANHMISPNNSRNSVYQLQMGKGKTSVITPMIACRLADSRRLVRIIIPKPLLPQMSRLLGTRLCRLAERPLLHLPYHRKSPSDVSTMNNYRTMLQETCASGGVLLVLPEHILSFQLNGIQRSLDHASHEAKIMLETQDWLDQTCRDVIDEADEILCPRTQLIYPSGAQRIVDGGTLRWNTVANTLHLTEKVLSEARRRYQSTLMVDQPMPTRFPFVHILGSEGSRLLKQFVIDQVCGVSSPLAQVSRLSTSALDLLRNCLDGSSMTRNMFEEIRSTLDDQASLEVFLVLRGLLGGGILTLALEKRWNVQYGLDLPRCQIAVPYQAKGRPTLASEFGHPDLAITLTYLAYYYNGVTENQLRRAIEHLRLHHDPALEWDNWVDRSEALPANLRSWKAVNLEDSGLVTTLWHSMAYSIPLINFFLSAIVFPQEAREFEKKLVSSSWDIPMTSSGTMTTGFSGTKDNNCLMPRTIRENCLPQQHHTNAEVLLHLLQDRNKGYWCIRARGGDDSSLGVEGLLRRICESKPAINVILDAGAQVLEMMNADVAQMWLDLRTDAPAVVYFNDKDAMMVLYRDGREEALVRSIYAHSLGEALLYLDEEHCRGTDVKLPASTRAALTLGLRLTKDRLVQAAMRMRQLGESQSVLFLAPPAVDRMIIDHNELGPDDIVNSSHVIRWAIEESCKQIDSQQHLFLAQGSSFTTRHVARKKLLEVKKGARTAVLSELVEKEARTLEDLYGPQKEVSMISYMPTQSPLSAELYTYAQQLQDPKEMRQASANEEQERELEVEVEDQRQMQRPPPFSPKPHTVHPDVKNFVTSGILKPASSGYCQAFVQVHQTSLAPQFEEAFRRPFEPTLLATNDFLETVQLPNKKYQDEAMRDVRWILWSPRSAHVLLIISQYEANDLLPDIQTSKYVHLCLYEAPRTRQMAVEFNELAFFSIPPVPKDFRLNPHILFALGLFAGRTFFRWREYSLLREWMSNLSATSSTQRKGAVRHFIRRWTQMRLHDLDFTHSPIGYICLDRPLSSDDAFFMGEM